MLSLQDIAGRPLYRSPNWPGELNLDEQSEARGAESASIPDVPELSATVGDVEQVTSNHRGFGAGRGGPPPVVFTGAPAFRTKSIAGVPWRFGVFRNEAISATFGLNQGEVAAELKRIRDVFWMSLPFVLLMVGLGGWHVAARALRPLKTIAQTAEHVTARGLDQRIPQTKTNPEAARLIEVLNRMMDRLESSFHQATRFSADASHELKTPLTVMQGELETALQNAHLGSAEQQVLNTLLEQVQRLKHITRSLLLLAQADAGQLKLSRETVNLTDEIRDAIDDANVLAEPMTLRIEAYLAPAVMVDADRALLHTVVLNLITNAIKYNRKGGRVSIKLEVSRNDAQLTLCNTGPGIAEEEQPRIFERFARSRISTQSSVEGVGLGLSLSREIARAHRGNLVLVESTVSQTCFRLEMPLADGPMGSGED
jgi:signal transduction histidine kinase